MPVQKSEIIKRKLGPLPKQTCVGTGSCQRGTRLTPMLDLRPEGLQVSLQSATEKNRARFVKVGVRNVHRGSGFDGGEFVAHVRFGRAHTNHDFSRVVARSP